MATNSKLRSHISQKLKKKIKGEVRFDNGSRAMYATDASNYRHVPIGVVIPKNNDDVLETISVCRKYGAPVLARGGGTSLAGQCCNVAVVLDFSKYMNRVIHVDPDRKTAEVEPGTLLDNLRLAAAQFKLTFGPDPATHNHCTLGGMIGNNSCGVHSVMAGRTADNVRSLEVATYQGDRLRVGATDDKLFQQIVNGGGAAERIYSELHALRSHYADEIRKKYPVIPRRVSGFNLNELLPERNFQIARALVGSEGTCVTVLSAEVDLVPNPPSRVMAVLGFPDIATAGDHVLEVRQFGPVGLEGIDHRLIDDLKRKKMEQISGTDYFPEGKGWLLCEFGGDTPEEAKDNAVKLTQSLKGIKSVLIEDEGHQQKLWEVRESGLGATSFVPGQPDTWPGWEDSAVPPDRLGEYLRKLRSLMDLYGYAGSFYGHFGDGCLHTRMTFDLASKEGVKKYRSFVGQASDLVISMGGSMSGEHGDGQARGELLIKMYGPDLLEAFRKFKRIWDPDWKMNPGKVIDPDPITSGLRLQSEPAPSRMSVKTFFSYNEDQNDFHRATLRCVGVGKCRRLDGGTMCPSYMATHEEKHATRGRAHLLYEMLRGQVVHDGWRNEAVKESLDLCLACKGCKGDCPVNVDLATYKAEFLAHYYRGRLRPRHAYAFGWLHRWVKLGAFMPWLTNWVTQSPVMSGVAKFAADIHPARNIPAFAGVPFHRKHHALSQNSSPGASVVLWMDTFNDYFYPEVLEAALRTMNSKGFEVKIPSKRYCCGRPLYDYGMLKTARKLLLRILDGMEEDIERGLPVVVLEPSCAATFRDEMVNLLPDDSRARKLSKQVLTLAEFFEKHAPDTSWPGLHARAVVQSHCHHKAIMGVEADKKIWSALKLETESVEGCCGMAGAFGFEKDHYDVSTAIANRKIVPCVQSAENEDLIMADGFSCREQIRQQTGRKAWHLAEVLAHALEGQSGVKQMVKEEHYEKSNR